MKIAYLRYNQNTDLDFAIASVASRNTEERLGILEAMVELGHEVTIVSWVPPTHRHVFQGLSKGPYDNSWMTSLKYTLDPDPNYYDMLFIETAATNTNFSFRPEKGKEVGFVAHSADILYQFQGAPIVVYHHGNKQLSFPFSRLSCMKYDELTDAELAALAPTNYRRIFQNFDIWDGYEYYVWHKAYNSDLFLESYATYYWRQEMELEKMHFISTPIGYSDRYDPSYPPCDPTTALYDLVYVGRNDRGSQNEGGRPDRILKLYDSPEYSALLVGKDWDKEHWKHGQVKTPGQDQYHGTVFDHYRKGVACIQVLNNEMAKAGMATTRHQQAIRAGVVCFIAGDIKGGAEWVGGNEFVVNTPDDVVAGLIKYCDDPKMLHETNLRQKQALHPWVEVVPRVLNVASRKENPDKIDRKLPTYKQPRSARGGKISWGDSE